MQMTEDERETVIWLGSPRARDKEWAAQMDALIKKAQDDIAACFATRPAGTAFTRRCPDRSAPVATMIDNTMRGPSECPKCRASGDKLVVATKEVKARPQFISNGRGAAEFIGYDCRDCGEQLRFKESR